MDTKQETRYNVPLLEQVRKTIQDESLHNQGIWANVRRSVLHSITERFQRPNGVAYIPVSCGTSACVAGWAAQLAGAKMLVSPSELSYDKEGLAEAIAVLAPNGQVRDISVYAREQLGLTEEEANYLFAAGWSNKQVLSHLENLIVDAKHGRDWKYHWTDEDDDDDG